MVLGALTTQPVLDVLVAAALTWAAHSSVAIVLLVMSLATKGVVPPDAAFALVLGANLGTAINPVLEGVSGDDPVARFEAIVEAACAAAATADLDGPAHLSFGEYSVRGNYSGASGLR